MIRKVIILLSIFLSIFDISIARSKYFKSDSIFSSNSNRFDNSTYNGPLVSSNYRKSKFFPLFTIIRFTNEVCKTTSEDSGICYTKSQCLNNGGVPNGVCAQSLGVCCQFYVGCSSLITQNGTTIRSPNYPSKFSPNTGTYICQIPIRKQPNICQLQLNFNKFEIDGPVKGPEFGGNTGEDSGSCKSDTLAISSSGAIVPPICGIMTGQHLYVNFGSSDTITLNIMLSNTQIERIWEIGVNMIACNSVVIAPSGCLQYFQGISGEVRSFNFEGGTHLANMDYSACVRMEDGMRAIEWSACELGSVAIGGHEHPATDVTDKFSVCAFDYVTIMDGDLKKPRPTVQDRFCDHDFDEPNNVVRSMVKPFLLHFKTNGQEKLENDKHKGFCLKWQQFAM